MTSSVLGYWFGMKDLNSVIEKAFEWVVWRLFSFYGKILYICIYRSVALNYGAK